MQWFNIFDNIKEPCGDSQKGVRKTDLLLLLLLLCYNQSNPYMHFGLSEWNGRKRTDWLFCGDEAKLAKYCLWKLKIYEENMLSDRASPSIIFNYKQNIHSCWRIKFSRMWPHVFFSSSFWSKMKRKNRIRVHYTQLNKWIAIELNSENSTSYANFRGNPDAR